MPSRIALPLSLALLSGCTGIPSTGPSASAFVSEASVSARQWTDAGFVLVPVNSSVMGYVVPEAKPSLRTIASDGLPAEAGVGVGDIVSVTIFEAGAGGLFSSGQSAVSGAAPMTRLPEQAVGRDGQITVPYAGRIRVAGLSPAAVESRIVAALRGRAVEPQAVVSVSQSQSNSVSVTGDAVGGTSVPIPASGLRVLDVIALAGGPTASLHEVSVTLTRAGRTAGIPMSLLVSDPGENVYLRGGDALLLTRQPRTFVALGATQQNAHVPLQGYDTTLAKALAQVGGLGRSEANASGVFLLRRMPARAVHGLVPNHPLATSSGEVPVIYQFDMSEPQGLIYAQAFTVQEGDILYVSTAPLASVRNTLNIFQGITSPALSTAAATSGL